MEQQRRKHSRVDVGLSISCTFIDRVHETKFTVLCHAFDLSLTGMKISVPVPVPLLHVRELEYYLDLPKPFIEIAGNAHIKWASRSPDNSSMQLGVEFSSLTPEQQTDLRHILSELIITEN
jgi:c-di-GMP-binding flagellar brake protein YcgR